MEEHQSLHDQMAAVSRSLDPTGHSQASAFENSKQRGTKKRISDAEEGHAKVAETEGENGDPKKMKRDSSLSFPFQNPQEEITNLESLAHGAVPDMSTVASSIAALSNQPPPSGWAFMVPPAMANAAGGTALAQQQLYQQYFLHQAQQAWLLQNMRDMQQSHDGSQGSRFVERTGAQTSAPTNIFTSQEGNGMFMILEQPNEIQRKSYKNENRCLLPNPITICQKEFLPEDKRGQVPMDGVVTVTLVDQDGEELPPNKANMLDSIERSTTQPLDENHTAQFSLKVLETSEGNMVRLLFTINYRLKNLGQCQEKILSRPFVVYSNRKKHVKGVDKEKPTLIDLKPSRGEYNKETEVWIKGRGFNDKVAVAFGDRVAKVVDSSENLVTVIAPPREDIVQDTPVEVLVSNKFARELFNADKKLTFLYTTSTPMVDIHRAVTASLMPHQPVLETPMLAQMAPIVEHTLPGVSHLSDVSHQHHHHHHH